MRLIVDVFVWATIIVLILLSSYSIYFEWMLIKVSSTNDTPTINLLAISGDNSGIINFIISVINFIISVINCFAHWQMHPWLRAPASAMIGYCAFWLGLSTLFTQWRILKRQIIGQLHRKIVGLIQNKYLKASATDNVGKVEGLCTLDTDEYTKDVTDDIFLMWVRCGYIMFIFFVILCLFPERVAWLPERILILSVSLMPVFFALRRWGKLKREISQLVDGILSQRKQENWASKIKGSLQEDS